MTKFEKHTLTRNQARRLNVPHLAGEQVDITLLPASKKPVDLANVRIAEDVYYNGERLGGTLSLSK